MAYAKSVPLDEDQWVKIRAAFENVKAALIHAPTIAVRDPEQILCIFTDASENGWGIMITQCDEQDL